MKELKFRVWDSQGGYYIVDCLGRDSYYLALSYGGLYRFHDGCSEDTRVSFDHINFHDKKDRYIVEQYTGLKDKNGKEIYEGDIVRCWNGLDYSDSSVKWSENSAAYFVKYFDKKDGFDEDDWLCDCYCEVIGNIHENQKFFGGEE